MYSVCVATDSDSGSIFFTAEGVFTHSPPKKGLLTREQAIELARKLQRMFSKYPVDICDKRGICVQFEDLKGYYIEIPYLRSSPDENEAVTHESLYSYTGAQAVVLFPWSVYACYATLEEAQADASRLDEYRIREFSTLSIVGGTLPVAVRVSEIFYTEDHPKGEDIYRIYGGFSKTR